MLLWKELASELASWCHTSIALDQKKLESRFEHEGLAFLAITLPSFGKDFERCLDQGLVDPGAFPSFKRRGGLPLFLGGFLDRVFDRSSGVLLDEPCVDSIFAIRQLTLMFKKIRQECSDARRNEAIAEYVQCEKELEASKDVVAYDSIEFRRLAGLLFGDALSVVDREVYNSALIPKHGPGRTADRLLGNEKYVQVVWPLRLEGVFPYMDNVLPSARYYREMDRVEFLEPDAEQPVRVVTVPKTLKTPRIIAVEPTCMQFCQQAILEALVKELESSRATDHVRSNIAHNFIGFRDQDPNRAMACEGSSNQSLATLDMSEASDRVSNQHVIDLLARWPHLSEAIQATRSTKADVPGFGIIPLTKFASMGSATCFPMEAMVFTTAAFMGIQNSLNTRLTRNALLEFVGKVRVYGDDIVVPTEHVSSVIESLESFGFKVNYSKSFWTGKFRESCGGDFYDGHDVSVMYVKDPIPVSRKCAESVQSTVAFRNLLHQRGLWQTCRYLDDRIVKFLPHYPAIKSTSALLGRHVFVPLPMEEMKMCKDLHEPVAYGFYAKPRIPSSPLDGIGALVKFFLRRGDEPYDEKHLTHTGRPLVVDIKRGWRPVA
jgi:hypothetical protein